MKNKEQLTTGTDWKILKRDKNNMIWKLTVDPRTRIKEH